MTCSWPKLALLSLIGLVGCADSHVERPLGATESPLACPTHYLAHSFGGPILVHANQGAQLSEPVGVAALQSDSGRAYAAVTEMDFDGDGLRDVVIRDSYGGAALVEEDIRLWLIRGSERPFLERPVERVDVEMRGTGGGTVSGVGDLDGDGISDLVIPWGSEGPNVIAGGTFVPTSIRCERGRSIGDVDGDGTLDTFCGDRFELSAGTAPADFDLEGNVEISPAGDVNGDRYGDVVVFRTGGTEWRILLGPDLLEVFHVSGSAFTAVGDVNGDGIDDLAQHNFGAYELYRGSPDGMVLLNDAFSSTGDESASEVPAGDINCDGYADVFGRRGGSRLFVRAGGPNGIEGEPLSRGEVRGRLTPVYD